MGPKRNTKTTSTKKSSRKSGRGAKESVPVIPPPNKGIQGSQPSQSSQGSQKHHFGRQNRLDDLFSSQPSQKKSKSSRNSLFEEDEGFIYKRMDSSQDKPQKSRKKAKQVSTPVSRLNQALEDLPGNDLNDSFDSIDFDLHNNVSSKRQKTSKNSNDIDDPDQEVVKLSSPIRPRYEDDISNRRNARKGFRSDTSSDDYIEQVSHHKLDLTGGEDDFGPNTSTSRKNQNNDRRSSYNNRGKRISSIGNGFVGLPHEDVSAKDYYKLLDTSLPEPHRMRQLLIWCISNRINEDEKKQTRSRSKSTNTEQQTVINIAKVIKEEVLQDLREGSINTSWYYRPEDEGENDTSIIANKEIVLPNPLNITTKENIAHFTKELAKLKREKEQWKKLYKKNTTSLKSLTSDINGKFTEKDIPKLKEYLQEKNPDLEEQVLNNRLLETITQNHDELKEKFSDNLEDSIDKLYSFTHQLTKANEIIETYKTEKLNPKISELTRNYVNKTKFENFGSESGKSLWPVPNKPLGVKELLKGIAQLDYSLSKSGDT